MSNIEKKYIYACHADLIFCDSFRASNVTLVDVIYDRSKTHASLPIHIALLQGDVDHTSSENIEKSIFKKIMLEHYVNHIISSFNMTK